MRNCRRRHLWWVRRRRSRRGYGHNGATAAFFRMEHRGQLRLAVIKTGYCASRDAREARLDFRSDSRGPVSSCAALRSGVDQKCKFPIWNRNAIIHDRTASLDRGAGSRLGQQSRLSKIHPDQLLSCKNPVNSLHFYSSFPNNHRKTAKNALFHLTRAEINRMVSIEKMQKPAWIQAKTLFFSRGVR